MTPEWVEVDLKRVRVECSRAFGGAWLGLELAKRLRLPEFLAQVMPPGREEIPWPMMALVLVLYRALDELLPHKAAFRIHKSDLELRPIWHQVPHRVHAHILVCFPAYVLWKTLRQLCERAGLGNEPRKVFDELKEIQAVDVVLPTRTGITLRKRCITRPTDHQAILLHHLGFSLPSHTKTVEL